MTFLSGLRKVGLTKLGRPGSGPDRRFGTGLWRQHHDRFLRAVDRYYATALAIAEEPGTARVQTAAGERGEAGAGERNPTGTDTAAASGRIAAGTHRLNQLVPLLDDLTAWLHAHHPVDGQVVPAPVRRRVSDAPELLAKASAKVAEAALAASMARTELLAGRPAASSAQACERFIGDAAELLERARSRVAEDDPDARRPEDPETPGTGAGRRQSRESST